MNAEWVLWILKPSKHQRPFLDKYTHKLLMNTFLFLIILALKCLAKMVLKSGRKVVEKIK